MKSRMILFSNRSLVLTVIQLISCQDACISGATPFYGSTVQKCASKSCALLRQFSVDTA